MATLEERVAYPEGRMEDQTSFGARLRADNGDLRTEMKAEFAVVRADIGDLRAETKREFAAVRADTARQFAEVRSDMARLFAEVRAEMRSDRHWIVGLMVTSLVAVGGAVVGLYFK
jgi:hypothetical protein